MIKSKERRIAASEMSLRDDFERRARGRGAETIDASKEKE
jgi:hypothetical protein